VQNPDDNSVRTAFLGLVERKGTTDQIENVLQETGKWLVQNPDDNSVRTAFLGLVERKGTTDQIENVLQETGKWLVQSPDDDSVRTAFLGLVERKGTTDQIENVLQETTSWLTHHNKAIGIWDALIALFVRLEKVEEAKNAIIEAISFNQDDLKLLDQYLRYFKNTGNEKTVKVIYEAQLKAYPNSLNIREHYAAWLREHNYLEDSKSQYEMLAHIAPKSFRARYGFGLLQLKLGDIDDAIEQFGECLKIHKGHVMAHLGLAQSFAEKTKLAKLDSRIAEFRIEFAKAEKEFNKAIYWAGINKNPQTLFHTQLGWFYIENDCYSEAKRTFELAMREDPEYFGNYWGIGHALMGLEQFREAEMALIMSLEKAPADFQAPASEKIPELLGKCQILLDDN
jgi:tetratricopeptide (TPR) repeat protein